MEMRRRDRRRPPRDGNLALRQLELSNLQQQVEGLMEDCPVPLRLNAESPEQALA